MTTKISGLLFDFSRDRHHLYSAYDLIEEVRNYQELSTSFEDAIPLAEAQRRSDHYKAKIDIIVSDDPASSFFHHNRNALAFNGMCVSRIIVTSLRKKVRFDIDISKLGKTTLQESGSPMLLAQFHPEGDIRIYDTLSPAAYSLALQSQRIPRTLKIPAGMPVSEILEMAEPKSWIPEGVSFNVGPAPDDKFVRQHFFDADGRWLDDAEKEKAVESSWTVGEPIENYICPEQEQTPFHYWEHKPWVRYHRKQDTVNGWSAYIPLTESPADGSIIGIPLKSERDRHVRDCMDDRYLYIQIRHTNNS